MMLLFCYSHIMAEDILDKQRNKRNLPINQGFGALYWGISLNDARKIYPDLREKGSRASNNDSARINRQYIRDKESLTISGYKMDEISYMFEKGKLISVSCHKDHPLADPEMFNRVSNAARGFFGKPYSIESRASISKATLNSYGGATNDETIKWKIDEEHFSITRFTVDRDATVPRYESISVLIFSYTGYFLAEGVER